MKVDLSKIPNMEQRTEAEKLFLKVVLAENEYSEAPADSEQEAKAKMDAAWDAYNVFDAPDLLRSADDETVLARCVLTGLPIFDDEPYLRDPELDDDVVLKAALGVPLTEDGAFARPQTAQAQEPALAAAG